MLFSSHEARAHAFFAQFLDEFAAKLLPALVHQHVIDIALGIFERLNLACKPVVADDEQIVILIVLHLIGLALEEGCSIDHRNGQLVRQLIHIDPLVVEIIVFDCAHIAKFIEFGDDILVA